MISITPKRKKDYIELSIVNNKDIIKLKYQYGIFDGFYFNEHGIEIDTKYIYKDKIRIYDKCMYSGHYTLFIIYNDYSFETVQFELKDDLIDERKNYIEFNQNLIKFMDFSSLNLDRIKKQLYTIVPLFDTTNTNDKLKDIFNRTDLMISDLDPKFINKKIQIKKITTKKDNISININLDTLNNEYVYGFVIISKLNYPILSGKFSNPILINNNKLLINIPFIK